MQRQIGRPFVLASVISQLAVACGGPHATTAPPAAPTPLKVARVLFHVTVRVANRTVGTAVPGDFTVSVTGGHATPDLFAGADDPASIPAAVDVGAPYAVSVTGPDGYVETLSPGCSGVSDQDPTRQCTIIETEDALICDPALWAPVYAKDRLRVLDTCKVASGTVQYTAAEHDGDMFLLIQPDPPYAGLLRPGNRAISNWLAVEVPCQGPIDQKDALGICDQFRGKRLSTPAQGTHIAAAAHWVEDMLHGNQGELHGARVIILPR